MESQRFASFMLISLMLLTLLPSGFMAGAPQSEHVSGTVTYQTGDWIVPDNQNRTNETIVLTGNLLIQAGGTLSFSNITLMMNSSTDGQFYIEVQAGGRFFLNDTDDDTYTTGDASRVTSVISNRGYLFHVLTGSFFAAKNSVIEKCGYLSTSTGASLSGLTLKSSSAVLRNIDIRDGANGIVIDSCNPTIDGCTITSNRFNGILAFDGAVPGYAFDFSVNNSAIMNNALTGFSLDGDNLRAVILGSTVSGNDYGGIMINGSSYVNATITGNDISENDVEGGIAIWGGIQCEVRADIFNNTLSGNTAIPVRVGFRAAEMPVKITFLNYSGNDIVDSINKASGGMFVFASNRISANLTDNIIDVPASSDGGLYIGKIIETINTQPSTNFVDVLMRSTNVTNYNGGNTKICAIETLQVSIEKCKFVSTGSCGGVYLGWISAGTDYSTPMFATLNLKNSQFGPISGGGGYWVKAIMQINATIENNTFTNVNDNAMRLGWLDDNDADDPSKLWAKPTKKVNAQIYNNTVNGGDENSIWLYSSDGSLISENVLSSTSGSNGIRVEKTTQSTKIIDNQIIGFRRCGIGIYESSGIDISNNSLTNNMYGIGLYSGSSGCNIENNTISKISTKYGFYIDLTALNNNIKVSNTVNGVIFRYFNGIHGLSTSLYKIKDIDAQNPPLMSNLGQVVLANSNYIELTNVTTANGTSGIALLNVDDSVIEGNMAKFCTALPGHGISLQMSSDRNVLDSNVLIDNLYGMGISSGAKNSLWGNNVTKTISTRGGLYITPSLTTFDNEIASNNSVNGDPVYFLWNKNLGVTVRDINISTPLMMNIGQMAVINSTNVLFENVSVANGVRGLYNLNSDAVTIRNSTLRDNTDGICAWDSSDLSVESSQISGGNNAVLLSSTEARFGNTTISGSIVKHINLFSSSRAVCVNTTFDMARLATADTSTLESFWYLGISVESSGNPLPGARVVLANITGETVLEAYSDASGTIPTDLYPEFIQDLAGIHYRSPYTLTVTKQGYSTVESSLPVHENQHVTRTLSDITSPSINVMPTVEPTNIFTSTDYIWLNATLNDSGSGNSTILAAEWSVAFGQLPFSSPSQMTATDGTFDEMCEDVCTQIYISSWGPGNYTFMVRGLDSAGNWMGWSNVSVSITDDQGPAIAFSGFAPPAKLGLSRVNLWFNLSINDTDGGNSSISEAEWQLFNHTSGAFTTLPMSVIPADGAFNEPSELVTVSINFRGWSEGQYTANIRGRDTAGNFGNWITWSFEVYDDIAPMPPSGLWVANTTVHGQLKLIWSENTESDVAGYSIFRTTVPGTDYEFVATVGADNITWSDSGLNNGTYYYYAMTAFDSASIPNESPLSVEVGAMTPAATNGSPSEPQQPDTENPTILPSETQFPLALAIVAAIAIILLIAIALKRRHPPKNIG